jgi:hypothetical protein
MINNLAIPIHCEMQSVYIQKELFKIGFRWRFEDTNISHTSDSPYLILSLDKKLIYCRYYGRV